jgi:hypothetical protein
MSTVQKLTYYQVVKVYKENGLRKTIRGKNQIDIFI